MRSFAAVALVVAGCSGPSVPTSVRPDCHTYEHRVGAKCVPNLFDTATIAPPPTPDQIDVDTTGKRYVRGTLFVELKDHAADGNALATRYGGQIIGAIPFIGLYEMTFADAQSDGALAARATTIAADPMVASASRDFAITHADLDMRPPTSFDMLTPTTMYRQYASFGTDVAGNPLTPVFAPLGDAATTGNDGAGGAWTALYSANPLTFPVVVSIVDTPVATLSGIFSGLELRNAKDLRPSHTLDATSDQQKHGTAVASIIGAVNGGKSANGILAGNRCIHYDLDPIAVSEDDGKPTAPNDARGEAFMDGFYYGIVSAVRAGADVVNISLGSSCMPGVSRYNEARRLRNLLARAPRVLFVIAAGNDDDDAATTFPASAARSDEEGYAGNVVAVAAIDEQGRKARWTAPGYCDASAHVCMEPTRPLCGPFSYQSSGMTCTTSSDCPPGQIGASNHIVSVPSSVTLAALGTREVATLPDGTLTLFQGTSGAAPLVSGAAALLFAILPALTGEQAKQILVDSAAMIPDQSVGGKRLDMSAAVLAAAGYQAMLAPSLDGQGDCGPKHMPSTPPPDTSHHQITGHYVKVSPICSQCGGGPADGSVDITGNLEGKGVIETRSVVENATYNDIWVGDVTLKPNSTKFTTFLHWEGACNGPDAEPAASGDGTIVLHATMETNDCRAVFDH